MREILFIGKRKDNGEWVEGYYVCAPAIEDGQPSIKNHIIKHWIITQDGYMYEVTPETIREYSGLTDKNKKRIFENHIVKAVHQPYLDGSYAIGVVTFSGGAFKLSVHQSKNRQEYKKYTDNNVKEYPIEHNFIERNYVLEVIGNTTDNPELLKGGVDNGSTKKM